MKRLLAAAALAALAGVAYADPLDDAKAGLRSLDAGDYSASIKLFSQALDSGRLSRADQELALVKRGEAYLATSDAKSALADSSRALDLQPDDKEALATRDRARVLLTPAPVASSDTQKMQADYQASLAKYDADRQASADAYAQQMHDYQAKVKAAEVQRQAELAAWQACKAGDQTQCKAGGAAAPAVAKPVAPPAPVKTAEATPPPAPKPVAKAAPKAAPKADHKQAELPPAIGSVSY